MRKISFGQKEKSSLDSLIENIRHRQIVPLISDNSKVLDVGCGYQAALLKSISDRINTGVGIDVSVTRKNIAPNIKLIKSSVEMPLPFKNSTFDFVIMAALIEHVNNPIRLLKEAKRVLTQGGRLLLTTPTKSAEPYLEFLSSIRLINREEINDHKRYYDETSIIKDLGKAGFNIPIEITRFEFGLNLFVKAKNE